MGLKMRDVSLVATLVELYFCCGMIFGWPNVVKVFLTENFFCSGCDCAEQKIDVEVEMNSTKSVVSQECQQDNMLTKAFEIPSTIFSITALFAGIIYDRFGSSITRFAASVLFLLGNVFLFIAKPMHTDV